MGGHESGAGRRRRAAGHLFERELELEALRVALTSAREGSGQVVIVEGAAGMGKSALLGRTRDLARQAGIKVFEASGSPLESDFPYGTVLQLFERPLAHAGPEERAYWLTGQAAPVEQLLGLGCGRDRRQPGPATFSELHGLLWLAINVAETSGLVLLVDDAHWADRPSMEFFRYLAARMADLPLLLVLAVRPGERGRVADLLAELEIAVANVVLRPQPLTDAGVAAMSREVLAEPSDALCRACARASGGNPFLLEELLLTMVSDPRSQSVEDVFALRPEAVAKAVLVRLARMPVGAVTLTRAVAALGSGCQLNTVATLAGMDRHRAVELTDHLVSAGILAVGADDSLVFVHRIIETIVEAEIPRAELESTHLRAAEMLWRAGAAPEQVSAHLLRAAVGGGAWVVDCLLQSGARAVRRGSPDIAIRQLGRALAEPLEEGRRRQVELELGRVEVLTGSPAGVTRVTAMAGREPPGHAGSLLLLEVGTALRASGRGTEAAAVLEQALDGLAEGSALESAVTAALSDAVPARRPVSAAGGSRRAGDDRAALGREAVAWSFRGEGRDEVLAAARRALEADGAVDSPVVACADLTRVATALIWNDDLDGATALLDRVVAEFQSHGSGVPVREAMAWRALTRRLRGDLHGATQDAEAVLLSPPEFGGQALHVAAAELLLAQLETGAGLGPLAIPESLAAATAAEPEFPGTAALSFARGCLEARQDRPEGVAGWFLEAGAALGRAGFTGTGWLTWRSAAGTALAAAGRRPEGHRLVSEELELARRAANPRAIGVALRAQGMQSRGDEGLRALRESVAVLADSPTKLEWARSTVQLGAALRRDGQRKQTREVLTEGLRFAEASGAAVLAEAAGHEMALCGGRPRRTAVAGMESLTAAERRVADLAAAGKTNRQIGELLYVSPKTVEFHLRQVFMKLGTSGRAELAGILAVPPAAAS